MGAPEPPPPIAGPELQNLTFDQLATLTEEMSPDAFYERAQAFDLAVARFEQVQDDFESQTRNMWSAWSGRVAESFDDVARKLTGGTAAVVQAMASPGYGAALRRAGDALAQARQRIKDLRAQNRQNDHEAARQVLYDLGTAYQDIGTTMTPMPEGSSDLPVSPGAHVLPVAGAGGGESTVHDERHGPVQPGGHGAGGIVMPVGTFMRQGEGPRSGWQGRGSSPTPALPSKESDSVVPIMLGRAAPAPSETGVHPRDQRQLEIGGVLGRQTQAKKAASKTPKAKKQAAEPTAMAEDGQQRNEKEQSSKGESTRTSSTGPAAHQASPREPLPAVATSEPRAVTPAAAPGPSSATAHVQAGPPPAPTNSSALPPAQASTPAAPPSVHASVPTPSPQGSLPTAHPPAPGPTGSAQPMGTYAPESHPTYGQTSSQGGQRSPGVPPVPGAFQSASGLDPTTTGMPAAAHGASGTPRPGGDMGTGGFMGGMAHGMPGHEKAAKEGSPAGFLTADSEAWLPDDAGVPVLGRRAPSPSSTDDEALPGIEAITRIEDPDELMEALYRLRRREGER